MVVVRVFHPHPSLPPSRGKGRFDCARLGLITPTLGVPRQGGGDFWSPILAFPRRGGRNRIPHPWIEFGTVSGLSAVEGGGGFGTGMVVVRVFHPHPGLPPSRGEGFMVVRLGLSLSRGEGIYGV